MVTGDNIETAKFIAKECHIFEDGEHVAMTLLVRSLPKVMVQVAAGLSLGVIGLFALILTWYGWDYFTSATQVYMVSDQIHIPCKVTAIVVPISGVIMLLHLVHGFALLEHFIDEQDVIGELIDNADGEHRS